MIIHFHYIYGKKKFKKLLKISSQQYKTNPSGFMVNWSY